MVGLGLFFLFGAFEELSDFDAFGVAQSFGLALTHLLQLELQLLDDENELRVVDAESVAVLL